MKLLNNKGQFSIVAALLVAIVLITALITTYSTVRDSLLDQSPQILESIGEMNLAIDHVLEFVVGYYGSIMQITGNTTYAKNLAYDYLESSLDNIAYMHPDWIPSFQINHSRVTATWFNKTSYSEGTINVVYSFLGLGVENVQYETSVGLEVTVNPSNSTSVLVNITRDGERHYSTLTANNFFFYNYSFTESVWKLNNTGVVVNSISSTEVQSTYNITIPTGVDSSSYMLRVADSRGIMVTATTFSQYLYNLAWNQSLYNATNNDTMAIEVLQNGTLRWLGQKLETTTSIKPIPPIPVKAIRINQTINGTNREVPFQIEDWGSEYRAPAGLTSNVSVFSSRQILVFLINHNVDNVTLWWDGRDISNQTSYAFQNRYFNDDPANGILSNGDLTLNIGKSIEHLYVDSFSWSRTEWIEVGSSPFLDDSDSSYIWDDDDYDQERYFYFEDASVGSGSVESAKIQFETRCSDDDYFQFQIFNGFSTYGWYSITNLPSSYGWKEYDVSSILSSLSRVNNARIEIRYRRNGGSSSDVYVRRSRLVIEIDSGFTISSTIGSSVAQAEFLRINGEDPVYGADPSYVIYNGSVRDIVQQEAEWSGGISGCPNLYAQIVLTLPANTTYYTYIIRPIFVDSLQSRTITELNALRLTVSNGQQLTENTTSGGYPVASNATGLFYNLSSPTGWAHHWSEFISGTTGAGIMFPDSSNQKLYLFDSIATDKTGALKVTSSGRVIEFNPVEIASASFQSALDISWHGVVVNFDGTDPIYNESDGIGLWVMVEYPPTVTIG